MGQYSPNYPQVLAKWENAGRKTVVAWASHDGITIGSPPTAQKVVGTLCTVTEVDEIPISFVNEREINKVGGLPLKINDGIMVDNFTITMFGNAAGTAAAFLGHSFNDLPALQYGQQRSNAGVLLILRHDIQTDELIDTTVVCNCGVSLIAAPGATTDGSTTMTVTFFSENARVFRVGGGYFVNTELFHNGAGVAANAAAPTGAIAAFDMGDGNGSNLTAPVAPIKTRQSTNPAGTNYTPSALGEYFFESLIKPAGTTTWRDITDAEATHAAGTVTFGTAPTNSTALFFVYPVASTDANAIGTGDDYDFHTPWSDYQA